MKRSNRTGSVLLRSSGIPASAAATDWIHEREAGNELDRTSCALLDGPRQFGEYSGTPSVKRMVTDYAGCFTSSQGVKRPDASRAQRAPFASATHHGAPLRTPRQCLYTLMRMKQVAQRFTEIAIIVLSQRGEDLIALLIQIDLAVNHVVIVASAIRLSDGDSRIARFRRKRSGAGGRPWDKSARPIPRMRRTARTSENSCELVDPGKRQRRPSSFFDLQNRFDAR